MTSKIIKQPWGYEWRTDDGKLHRLDGPAIEYINGTKAWYVNDKLHRLDGPAVEHSDGSKSWCVNDIMLSEKAFNKHPLVIKHRNRKRIEEWLTD